MDEKPKKKYRIGGFAVVILFIIALFFDLISFIPFVGDIFWVFMSYYLYKTGHGLLNLRRLVPIMVSFITESIPFLSSLPSIMAATISIIMLSRIEDKTGISITSHTNIAKPQIQVPLYQDGRRLPKKV